MKTCPICKSEAKKTYDESYFPVKGNDYFIKYKCWRCSDCDTIFIDQDSDDPFKMAKEAHDQ